MKILALLHGYPPLHNAGAEWMAHEMLKFLTTKGHDVEVLMPISELTPYNFEGVRVERDIWEETKEKIPKCDLLISHLNRAGRTLNLAEFYHKPFVQIIHNTNLFDLLNTKHRDAEFANQRFVYVIYNSEYTRSEMHYLCPGIIVHPPVDRKRYQVNGKIKNLKIKTVNSKDVQVIKPKAVKTAKKITLINLFERKGGQFFNDLARLMPDREFLGVEGSYGKQEKGNLKNVSYLENTANIKSVYADTRILLMPSKYESYGRTGIEAMCSGIPVIAAPTPGLVESLGEAGIFCSLDSPMKWVEAIKELDNEEKYTRQSKKCLDHSLGVEIEINKELEAMNVFFEDILNKRV